VRVRYPNAWEAVPKSDMAWIYVERFASTGMDDYWMYLGLADHKALFQLAPAGKRLVALGLPAIRPLYWKLDDKSEMGSSNGILNGIYGIRRCDLAAAFTLKIFGRDPTALSGDPTARDGEIVRLKREIERMPDVWSSEELKRFEEK
jgi:hypothetical protein